MPEPEETLALNHTHNPYPNPPLGSGRVRKPPSSSEKKPVVFLHIVASLSSKVAVLLVEVLLVQAAVILVEAMPRLRPEMHRSYPPHGLE